MSKKAQKMMDLRQFQVLGSNFWKFKFKKVNGDLSKKGHSSDLMEGGKMTVLT